MEDRLVYETPNFVLLVPNRPHVSRLEGGHIFIREKNKFTKNRYEIPPMELVELMRFTTLAGEAFEKAMNSRGVKIKRLNYHDDGNWAYLRGEEPFMHIHIYGRTEYSDKQTWGEALMFPNPFTAYYDEIEPINAEDIQEIKKQIELLENEERYSLKNWNL